MFTVKQIRKTQTTANPSYPFRMEGGKGKRKGFTCSQLAFMVLKKKAGNDQCTIPPSSDHPKKIIVRDLSKYTLFSLDEMEGDKNYFDIPMPCRIMYGPKNKQVLPIKLKQLVSGEYVYDLEDKTYQTGVDRFFRDRLVDNRVVGRIPAKRIVKKLKEWIHEKFDCDRWFLDAYIDSYNFSHLLFDVGKPKTSIETERDSPLGTSQQDSSIASQPNSSMGGLEALLCKGFEQLTTSHCQTNHNLSLLTKTFHATSEQVAETSRIAAENKVGIAAVNNRVNILTENYCKLQDEVNDIRDSIRKGWDDVLLEEQREKTLSIVPTTLFASIDAEENTDDGTQETFFDSHQRIDCITPASTESSVATAANSDVSVDSNHCQTKHENIICTRESFLFKSSPALDRPHHVSDPISLPFTEAPRLATPTRGLRTTMRIAPAASTTGRKSRKSKKKRRSESTLDFILEIPGENTEDEELNQRVGWDEMTALAQAGRRQALQQMEHLYADTQTPKNVLK